MLKVKFSEKTYILLSSLILIIHALVLYIMGRVPICKCGYIKFWHGITHSSENSQQLTDWYTFSHIIHGFFFYWLALKLFPKSNIWFRAFIAILPEVAWEVIENTPLIINRYRTETLSLDYFGDSVINSVSDVIAMILGFWMAYKLPVWLTIALTIFMELFVLYFIRDNLTLNIIMLLYPLQAIKNWQGKTF